MKVTVEYTAQVRRISGVASEEVELNAAGSLHDLIGHIVASHGEALRELILDSHGKLRGSILVFVGDNQVRRNENPELCDRDVVTLVSPISGG